MTDIVASNGTALEAFTSMAEDEASGFNATVVRIGIDHQNAEFKYPGLEGQKRITGVYLASRKVRCFFPKMGTEADTNKIMQVTGGRPLCSSLDCITGEVTIEKEAFDSLTQEHPAMFLKQRLAEGGLKCSGCPFGQWESVTLLGAEGRGQACKELRRLLYWQSGIIVPVILTAPSSSIKAWDGYCSSLGAAGMRHNIVVTEASLQIVETPGRKFSTIEFSYVSGIKEEMAQELIASVEVGGVHLPLYQSLINIFTGREIEASDYPMENGSESPAGDDL